MWTWSLNWGEITPRLLIGTCPMTSSDLGLIREQAGASAVLSLQHDDCLAYWGIDYGELCTHAMSLGLRMCRSPMRDFDIADQRRHLPGGRRAGRAPGRWTTDLRALRRRPRAGARGGDRVPRLE